MGEGGAKYEIRMCKNVVAGPSPAYSSLSRVANWELVNRGSVLPILQDSFLVNKGSVFQNHLVVAGTEVVAWFEWQRRIAGHGLTRIKHGHWTGSKSEGLKGKGNR